MEWKWNGKGMEMKWEWDVIGLEMEQKWNGKGMKMGIEKKFVIELKRNGIAIF